MQRDETRRKVPIPALRREVWSHDRVPSGAPSALVAGSDDSAKVIQDLRNRIYSLEQLLSNQPHVLAETPGQFNRWSKQGPGAATNLGTLNVKGSRSRFRGQNQKMTLLNEVSSRSNAATLALY